MFLIEIWQFFPNQNIGAHLIGFAPKVMIKLALKGFRVLKHPFSP
jgi:hypothetical protein